MARPQESDSGDISFDSKKRLVIKDHIVKDEDVIDYFRDAKSPAEMKDRLDKALKI